VGVFLDFVRESRSQQFAPQSRAGQTPGEGSPAGDKLRRWLVIKAGDNQINIVERSRCQPPRHDCATMHH
jgi:hypothetical protein